jgi:hypothetical protein
MSKPDEYSTNAHECERMAENCLDLNNKAAWLQMARHWLRMTPTTGPGSERFEPDQGYRTDQARKAREPSTEPGQ